jgi:transcriptional regulator NrdR family protein
MQVYLAGPITGCTDDQKRRWRKEIKEYVQRLGHKVVDPTEREANPEREPEDIEQSDIIVANLWRESIGTVFGIIRARSTGKPVILIDPNYVVRGSKNPVLKEIVGEELVDNLEEAKKLLEKLIKRLSERLAVWTRTDTQEDFKPRKLLTSISNACRAGGISDSTVFPVALSKRVEAALRSSGASKLTTEDIKHEVFHQLANLSRPADKTYPDAFKKKAAEVLKAWEQYEKTKDSDRVLKELGADRRT